MNVAAPRSGLAVKHFVDVGGKCPVLILNYLIRTAIIQPLC